MQLEEGKTYKSRGGGVFGPLVLYNDRPIFVVYGEVYAWDESGNLVGGGVGDVMDLVEEVSGEGPPPNPYTRTLPTYPDGTSDVYCVLKGYNVTDPAIAHAVKKLLAPGCRSGGKSYAQDLEEAMQSIQKALDLEGSQ